MLTKGLEGAGQDLKILPHALRSRLPAGYRDQVKVNAIGGPSIAGELAVRRHTAVVVCGPDQALLDKLAGWLRTPYYHVWTSTDLVGVEVCVSLKNIYALAVGLVIGLLEKADEVENQANMYNLAAAIFAQGLWEMAYMVEKMGGRLRSVYSLPGGGDLYVTSQGGRNCRMGRWLGLGMPYSQAKARHMPDDTIEGAELAMAIGPTVERMIEQAKLDGAALPLMRAMINIVCHDAPVQIPWDDFFCNLPGSLNGALSRHSGTV
jgi:glycerol-3-phosphate dehydrogenase (NAD(P)+)